jgi:hypothetical protein
MRRPGEPSPTDRRWIETLDALAASLTTGEPVELPDDLGPLPPHLLDKAKLVLAAHEAAIEQVTAERDRVGAQLTALHRTRPTRSAMAPMAGSSTLGTSL